MTADPRQRRQTIARAAIIGALALGLVSCPGWGGDSARTTLIMFAYYAALAQMWNLLAGYAGLVTFGQQLFIGVGAYSLAVGCERLGLGLWIAFALPAVVCGVLAVPAGALLFRLKGGYLAVGSWLVAEVCRLLFINSEFLGQGVGMFVRPARSLDPWVVYYVAIGLLLAIVGLVVVTLRSRAGLALMAVRDAEDAAAGLGVHVWRVKLLVFVVAAAGTGLVAALIAVQSPFVEPKAAFGIQWSADISFMAVVGGLGTIEGPLLGAAIYVALQSRLGGAGAVHMIVLGAVSVLVMLVEPRGIAGLVRARLGWTLFPIARRAPSRASR